MAEQCRETCPIYLWAESQGRAANIACRGLASLYMNGVDEVTEAIAEEDSPSQVAEEALEQTRLLGPRVAQSIDSLRSVEDRIAGITQSADSNCYGPEIDMDVGAMQTIVRCGGFSEEVIEHLIDVDKNLRLAQTAIDGSTIS